MMTDETPSTDPKQQIPDLSGLADFQFGPAWARPGARQERPVSYPERRSGDRQGGDRRPCSKCHERHLEMQLFPGCFNSN